MKVVFQNLEEAVAKTKSNKIGEHYERFMMNIFLYYVVYICF